MARVRGVIVVELDDPTADIDALVVELAPAVQKAVGQRRIHAVSGQVADDLLDLLELHGSAVPQDGTP